jgi:hypothetical protein
VKKILLVTALLFLSACHPSTAIERFADDAKEEIARVYIQRVIDGDTAALAAELDPALQSKDAAAELEKVRGFFPKEAPTTTNLIGYNVHHSSAGSQYNLTYQFGYGSKWVIANAAWQERPDRSRVIVGLNVQVLAQSLQETNAFTFKHAGFVHYLFFAAAILVPLFIVVTLVVCVRTKIPRRKWLWILFILVGVVGFSLNWTTGAVGIRMISIHLLGAGFSATSVYSPWILTVAIPLGAIVFWVKRRRFQDAPPPPSVLTPPPLGDPSPPIAH